MNGPLVSILIPAYNAEAWISHTVRSALAQTWQRKEIIVVDDGSTDRTAEIVQRMREPSVTVVSKKNEGAAATRNYALKLSRGDYIQWLDADDLLAPDKIERQLGALRGNHDGRLLLSCSWAYFYYRTQKARFIPTALWKDLSPVDWLLSKMSENLHMQPATWLTSRVLADSTGPWDTRLITDDDGEYYCRILSASAGTRFVPEAKVYYRVVSMGRWSYVGNSDRKKDALLLSMKLHIKYLRALEDSERVRRACLTYLQTWYEHFYPERPDIVAELQRLAAEVQGELKPPRLRWKYAWMRPAFGWKVAKWAQRTLPQWRASLVREWDRALFRLDERQSAGPNGLSEVGVAEGDSPALKG